MVLCHGVSGDGVSGGGGSATDEKRNDGKIDRRWNIRQWPCCWSSQSVALGVKMDIVAVLLTGKQQDIWRENGEATIEEPYSQKQKQNRNRQRFLSCAGDSPRHIDTSNYNAICQNRSPRSWNA